MLKLLLFYLTCCLSLPACVQAKHSEPQEQSHKAETSRIGLESEDLYKLKVGTLSILIERACTDQEQQQGLMFRKSMPENQGMLFVFDRERPLSFWMKNTLIPLSIAYIDKQGKIIDIQKMQPLDETGHLASGLAQYALEMNQGWFEKNMISVGASIQIDDFCSGP